MGTLLTFLAVGLVTLIAAGIVLSVLGTVFSLTMGLAAFLLFKVAPIMLLGWVALKLLDRARGRRKISDSDRRWLEEG
jgi:threonine/homoserine/homoserine lactone efflux protein